MKWFGSSEGKIKVHAGKQGCVSRKAGRNSAVSYGITTGAHLETSTWNTGTDKRPSLAVLILVEAFHEPIKPINNPSTTGLFTFWPCLEQGRLQHLRSDTHRSQSEELASTWSDSSAGKVRKRTGIQYSFEIFWTKSDRRLLSSTLSFSYSSSKTTDTQWTLHRPHFAYLNNIFMRYGRRYRPCAA